LEGNRGLQGLDKILAERRFWSVWRLEDAFPEKYASGRYRIGIGVLAPYVPLRRDELWEAQHSTGEISAYRLLTWVLSAIAGFDNNPRDLREQVQFVSRGAEKIFESVGYDSDLFSGPNS